MAIFCSHTGALLPADKPQHLEHSSQLAQRLVTHTYTHTHEHNFWFLFETGCTLLAPSVSCIMIIEANLHKFSCTNSGVDGRIE